MSDAYKRHVIEKSVFYRKREGELKEYERVNSAATDLCLRDVSLLDKRGKLLQLKWQMMAMCSRRDTHCLKFMAFHNTKLLQNGLSIARK